MDKLFIVANLKSYMNEDEAREWLDTFLEKKEILENYKNKQVIIAPSFQLLKEFKLRLKDTSVKLSAQNISPFDEGAYTGEVNAKQVKDFVEYVIIGHSERRNNFNETDEILTEKVKMALKYGLIPIYCVQDKNTKVPENLEILAYEPVFAIGSGTPDTPENANKVADFFVTENNKYNILYGGSVSPQNVHSFANCTSLKGVLVGGASLKPLEFIQIIQNA